MADNAASSSCQWGSYIEAWGPNGPTRLYVNAFASWRRRSQDVTQKCRICQEKMHEPDCFVPNPEPHDYADLVDHLQVHHRGVSTGTALAELSSIFRHDPFGARRKFKMVQPKSGTARLPRMWTFRSTRANGP
jgi:hypothetical protein